MPRHSPTVIVITAAIERARSLASSGVAPLATATASRR